MFSIYTTEGVLAHIGPDGKPYAYEKQALASVDDRNIRAAELGIKVRYEVKPTRGPQAAA